MTFYDKATNINLTFNPESLVEMEFFDSDKKPLKVVIDDDEDTYTIKELFEGDNQNLDNIGIVKIHEYDEDGTYQTLLTIGISDKDEFTNFDLMTNNVKDKAYFAIEVGKGGVYPLTSIPTDNDDEIRLFKVMPNHVIMNNTSELFRFLTSIYIFRKRNNCIEFDSRQK